MMWLSDAMEDLDCFLQITKKTQDGGGDTFSQHCTC